MARTPSTSVLAFLQACIRDRPYIYAKCSRPRQPKISSLRTLHTATSPTQDPIIPLRKQLKDEARARKLSPEQIPSPSGAATTADDTTIDPALLAEYELTVGLELHVELSTANKLFSPATTPDALSSPPNTHVAPFDLALPGAQPQFQKATLLPAIRAALALGCDIQRRSKWDRKHYFWWDQPGGYQITQFYEPFALNGHLTLHPSDLPPASTSRSNPDRTAPVTIPLKQIQLEQDTAKTTLQPPHTHLLDFNRVSHPLIEIITHPTIHDPHIAAAFVRKVQATLKAVGACARGMEMGGLRVDANVSVRRRDGGTDTLNTGADYAGYTALGQRTEIKNLSSVAAVGAAVAAERNRQIGLLERGKRIEGETRGWTLGATATHWIRGKEGEVDYRYMPDPDLPALVVGDDLVEAVTQIMPMLPEELVGLLEGWGVGAKDARTLVALEDGERAEWWFCVVEGVLTGLLQREHGDRTAEKVATLMTDAAAPITEQEAELRRKVGRLASNWVLHEMGALLTSGAVPFETDIVPAQTLADILVLLLREQITLPTAKKLLGLAFGWTAVRDVEAYVDANGLRLAAMSEEDYLALAAQLVAENEKMAEQVRNEVALLESRDADSGQEDGGRKKKRAGGKMMWFVGQMVRKGEAGRVQPERAEKAVRRVLLEKR